MSHFCECVSPQSNIFVGLLVRPQTTKTVKTFVETKASETIGQSHTSVSNRIKDLEAWGFLKRLDGKVYHVSVGEVVEDKGEVSDQSLADQGF